MTLLCVPFRSLSPLVRRNKEVDHTVADKVRLNEETEGSEEFCGVSLWQCLSCWLYGKGHSVSQGHPDEFITKRVLSLYLVKDK